MYDGHIYCKEYKELKDYIVDILNGEIEDYDVDELANHIQELYDSGEMPSTNHSTFPFKVSPFLYKCC